MTEGAIDQGEPGRLGAGAVGRVHPHRRQPERRVLPGEPLDAGRVTGGVERHEPVGVRHALADLQPAQEHAVAVGVEPEVVAQVHRGQHDAEVGGELLAERGDAARQLGALGHLDERDEPVPHLELQRFHREEILHLLRRPLGGGGRGLGARARGERRGSGGAE